MSTRFKPGDRILCYRRPKDADATYYGDPPKIGQVYTVTATIASSRGIFVFDDWIELEELKPGRVAQDYLFIKAGPLVLAVFGAQE